MLTPDGIRRAVLGRLDVIYDNCNHHRTNHNEGVIRGLLWALNGEDPGTFPDDLKRILDLAGIPCRPEGQKVIYATPGDADWPGEGGDDE